jgi:NTE family protein
VLVNGVFKGGGAKGIVYAGALRAVHKRGLRFVSVAGSSAGAITATLAACNLSPDDMERIAVDAMAGVRRRLLWGAVPFASASVFDLRALEQKLEEILVSCVSSGRSAGPVSFAELYQATQIELNVVATDLHRHQPVVFNYQTSPNCGITAAVLASCAVPVIMTPGRVAMKDAAGSTSVYRLVDGGAWANYPMFVYTDRSFRQYHQLSDLPEEAVTLGFVIDPPPPSSDKRLRLMQMFQTPRDETDYGSGARSTAVVAFVNWPFVRGLLVGLFPTLVTLVILDWIRLQTPTFFPSLQVVPTFLHPYLIVPMTAALVLFVGAVVAVASLLYRFGREAFDVGIPSILAMLSVGPRVPDWAGTASNDRVIRLSPPARISMLSFRAPIKAAKDAISKAHDEAATQLTWLFPRQDGSRELPQSASATVTEDLLQKVVESPLTSRVSYGLALFFLIPATTLLSWMSLGDIASGHWLSAAAWGASSIVPLCICLGWGLMVRQREVQAARRKTGLITPALGLALSTWALVSTVGLVSERLSTWTSLAAFSRAQSTFGTVRRKQQDASGDSRYHVEFDRPTEVRFDSVGGTAQEYCNETKTCVEFVTYRSSLQVGDETEVLISRHSGVAILAGDLWNTYEVSDVLYNAATLTPWTVFFVWSVRSLTRAARARRAGRPRP